MIINKIDIKREQSFRSSASLSSKTYKQIGQDSAEYIKYCYGMLRKSCNNTVEVNVESGRLMDIVNLKEPAIFIMNHTGNAMRDIQSAKFFNTLLYREYVYNGTSETAPRSKVFASENVLASQPDGGEMYKWLGVIPIKAKMKGSKSKHNTQVISETVEQLRKGKINLFLFPEGVFCAFPFLPLSWKFQAGVSSIIKKVLELRDKIKVIPLGFAHKKDLSSIHISKPIDFIKQDEKYKVSEEGELMTLMHNKKPIPASEIIPYISGFLTKKLENARQKAKTELKSSKNEVFEL